MMRTVMPFEKKMSTEYCLSEDIRKYGTELVRNGRYWHAPYDSGKVGLQIDTGKRWVTLVRRADTPMHGNLKPRHELVPKEVGIRKDVTYEVLYQTRLSASDESKVDGLIFQIMDREGPNASSNPVFQIIIRDGKFFLRYHDYDYAAGKWTRNARHIYLSKAVYNQDLEFTMKARLGRKMSSMFEVRLENARQRIELKTKCTVDLGQVQVGFYGLPGVTVTNVVKELMYMEEFEPDEDEGIVIEFYFQGKRYLGTVDVIGE
jgi:hypothetical protein